MKSAPPAPGSAGYLGWIGIIRLGLVQTSLGAIVVLATSTFNRVMVVELALPALLPGALVALHYTIQILRPRLGYGSDLGNRRTPWIVGGIAVLALGGVMAAMATALMANHIVAGIALALLAYVILGIGVGSAGTSLLVLLAQRVEARRRAAAASIVWVMMIAGFVISAGSAGHFLEPFSLKRLVEVTAVVSSTAFVVSLLAVWGLEGKSAASAMPEKAEPISDGKPSFSQALRQVWQEPMARNFALFVFVSMLGYSAQELILEPFAGAVFHLPPGESAKLTGVQNGGALAGMIIVAILGSLSGEGRASAMRVWTIGGCVGSALGLLALAAAGYAGPSWPLRPTVFALGVANGAFAVSAIGAMMGLAGDGRASREGVRMGLWGAAQAVAFAAGGLAATLGSDLARHFLGSPVTAYACVFAGEALLFLIAARQAMRVFETPARRRPAPVSGPFAESAHG